MIDLIVNALQLVLIVFGFGTVVFIHEFGHFLAARWAGVKVLAFAVGFGPAMLSFRKGMGIRRGSSEAAYQLLLYAAQDGHQESGSRDLPRTALAGAISPTEYRLNWLPLGGYVKMLGQDDADPGHRSEDPDSFQVKPVWKRMVIISAGVVANIVSAAALFVIVFSLGLEKPDAVVGSVAAGTPAAEAIAIDAARLGITEPGLRPGDRVLSIDSDHPRSFDDAQMAILTARADRTIELSVARPGIDEPVRFEITPRKTAEGILAIGIGPAGTTTLADPGSDETRAQFASLLASEGLGGIGSGWTIKTINGAPVSLWHDVEARFDASRGEPLQIGFSGPAGETETRTVSPVPVLQTTVVNTGTDEILVHHLAGLAPVMTVGSITPSSPGFGAGLREGDVFVELGGVDYPDAASGIASVRAHSGSTIQAVVSRQGERVQLALPVSREGRIGFRVGGTDTFDSGPDATRLSDVPGRDRIFTRPGSRLLSINGDPVTRFRDLVLAVQASREAEHPGPLDLVFEAPITTETGEPMLERVSLDLSKAAASLGWAPPIALSIVEADIVLVRSEGPLDAISMGLGETHRIMLTTYLTFARLAQGSIAPQMLNGPVGIVHAGTNIADRGLAWLLFFFALVSVNLAVINFLPIPITDGGHMVFLIWEQFTGKSVSIAVQNFATLTGLVMIVGTFLFVTYNDVLRLIG